MTDEIPVLTSVNTEMNPRATEVRLLLGDSSGRTTKLRVELGHLEEISDALLQMSINTQVARRLGRQSVLSTDAKGSAPATGVVIDFVAVGLESGLLVMDLQLQGDKILRLAFDSEQAVHMRRLFSDESLIPTRTN